MHIIVIVCLSTILTSCGSLSIKTPTVKLDASRLDSLPANAGYTILMHESEGLADIFRELGSKGMDSVDTEIQSICVFDPAGAKIAMYRGTYNEPELYAYDVGELELFAFQVKLSGVYADRENGWPIERMVVRAGKKAKGFGYDALCNITWILEDRTSPADTEQQLTRIFSAGRQIGMQLSCENISC